MTTQPAVTSTGSGRRRLGLGELRTIDAWEAAEGVAAPLGATWVAEIQAWNFALHSQFATGVTLLLYDAADVATPVLTIPLDPLVNKTGRIWHAMVQLEEAPLAAYYAWRVTGPWEPTQGHRFDPSKVLSDPHARSLFLPPDYSRQAAAELGRANDGRAILGRLPSGVPGPESSDALPPRHTADTIVYEVHVKGFTARANSGVSDQARGTFAGIIEKIPHLLRLGVTVVELLPVQQFDPQEGNYWGYMTLNFFTPHAAYAAGEPVEEFRRMVRALHAAGIEVWLDVVYNHTAEGGVDGPTFNLRGIDNRSFYLLTSDGQYRDDSGCGNTIRAADPALRALVLQSLRYWAVELGVDGFRFDLASILTRDGAGGVSASAPLISEISSLAAQLDVKVVAEAWDLSAYLLGRGFPGIMWRQWNGKFRDDVRGFVRGEPGRVGELMTRVYGSSDVFPDGPGDVYRPYQSINYITAHDGFCAYDLVSYNEKRNWANGQENRDGTWDNRSWNCGWEGDEGVPAQVMALRFQQLRNFAAILMLANGVPMIVAGDEFANTQGGNNNPYNQDNETTWLDWGRLEANAELFEFWVALIAFRKQHRAIARSRFWRDDVTWLGPDSPAIDFGGHAVAWILRGTHYDEPDLYVMVNSADSPREFTIQRGSPDAWRRIIDTATAPHFVDDTVAPPLTSPIVALAPRSVVVLLGSA